VVVLVVVGPTTVVDVVDVVEVVVGGSVVVVGIGEHDAVVAVDDRFDVEDRAAVLVAAVEWVDPEPPPLLEPLLLEPLLLEPLLLDPLPVLEPLPVVGFSRAWPPA
jgi:hypothetical protein